jgi:hypothetical protein
VNPDLVSTAPASAPASSAWAAASAATPLSLRKDADEGFPLGGAVLLIVLMAAAVWAWWYGRIRGGGAGGLPSFTLPWGRPAGAARELRIVESMQAAGGTRLMVVEWAGGRRVLVATQGANAPVTLDVIPGAAGPSGDER